MLPIRPQREADFVYEDMFFYFDEMVQYNESMDKLFAMVLIENKLHYYYFSYDPHTLQCYKDEIGDSVDIAYSKYVNSTIESVFL